MMRKITLLLILLIGTYGFAQNAPIDFESGGIGADWTWRVFENVSNPPLEIIANPVPGGINNSTTVAKFTALKPVDDNDGKFAGFESTHGQDIGSWTVTEQNSTVKVMVYQVGFASEVGLKFATPSAAALPPVIATVTAADQWVELTFDMSAWINSGLGDPDQIIFFPDNVANRSEDHIIYIDNVTFLGEQDATCDDGVKNGDETGIDCGGSCGNTCPPPPIPMVSAPIPQPAVEDVLFLYSDAYTNSTYQVTVNTWADPCCSNFSAPEDDTFVPSTSDNIKGYNDLNNVFIKFENVDATDMNYFHVDVWSANATTIRIGLQDITAAVEGSQSFPIVQNQWNSLEIDFDSFGGLTNDRDAIFQLILFGEPVGVADYFIDNVYFSKTVTLGDEDFKQASFKTYPNPTKGSWTINSASSNILEILVFDVLGKKVMSMEPNASEVIIDGTVLNTGLYFAKIKTDNAVKNVRLIKN